MKTLFLVPGSGGSFYCQNCCRDYALVKALRKIGHEATIAPMYLPLDLDDPQIQEGKKIFYGAIRVYLNEKWPFFSKMPSFFRKYTNSLSLLKWAAKRSGKTHSSGMEEITLSLLKGENGNQKKEQEELISWLKEYEKPDAIFLSNALLSGIAKAVHQELRIPVFCFLQDEHQWVESMSLSYQEKVWEAIYAQGEFIQRFLPVSDFYSDYMQQKLRLPPEKFQTIYPGISLEDFVPSSSTTAAIGYVSRWDHRLGLGVLFDAFSLLKEEKKFKEWKLFILGGKAEEDEKFLAQAKRKLEEKKIFQDIQFFPHFHEKARKEFYSQISILCVPNSQGEAFGLFLLEAQASCIPVVQPLVGSYPEILQKTQGGILCESCCAEALAAKLSELILVPEIRQKLGMQGRMGVQNFFTVEQMAKQIESVFLKEKNCADGV